MACSSATAILLSLGVYLVLEQPCLCSLAKASEAGPAPRRRPPLPPTQYLRVPLGDVLFDDPDELQDINKRQFDDYGHMRFGKRGDPEDKFDDYGHMRFGRGHL